MGFFSLWAAPETNTVSTTSATADACPVDHQTRSVWLQQQQQQKEQTTANACPVDPHARSVWLQQQQQQNPKPDTRAPQSNAAKPVPQTAFAASPSEACSSDTIGQSLKAEKAPSPSGSQLSQEREVSTIPRAMPTYITEASANAETSAPETSQSGNWIYPSEAQFFNAVVKKNHNTPNTSPENLAETVSSIIPIHNAVNERSWQQIRDWEKKHSTPKPTTRTNNPRTCPPKLLSFRGSGSGPTHDVETSTGLIMSYVSLFDPRTPLTPRARWYSLLGYQTPFDRHDWVVKRCDGEEVEYVIDFYQGKSSTVRQDGARNLNFFLDVRPKLNTVEGAKMRWRKAWGSP